VAPGLAAQGKTGQGRPLNAATLPTVRGKIKSKMPGAAVAIGAGPALRSSCESRAWLSRAVRVCLVGATIPVGATGFRAPQAPS
jgi:hypothetical protein